jgi:DsbC/DsbD-like thiol-disulfide interchange protein
MIRASVAALVLLGFFPSSERSTHQADSRSPVRPAIAESPALIDTPHMRVALSGPARAVTPGARISLYVDVTPKPKMHVYSPGQADYIPISVTLDKSDAYAAGPARFPKPETLYFKPLDEMQLVFSKPFRIVQDVRLVRQSASPARAAGHEETITIAGTLRYQACDDTLCYAPRNVPLAWKVALR